MTSTCFLITQSFLSYIAWAGFSVYLKQTSSQETPQALIETESWWFDLMGCQALRISAENFQKFEMSLFYGVWSRDHQRNCQYVRPGRPEQRMDFMRRVEGRVLKIMFMGYLQPWEVNKNKTKQDQNLNWKENGQGKNMKYRKS